MAKKIEFSPLRGFSLGTKLILLTVMIETITIGAAVSNAYRFLAEQRISHYRQILISQSDLLAKEVELKKESVESLAFDEIELGSFAAFQIVDTDGKVIWDSKDPKRAKTFILAHHPLFSNAKKSTLKRGVLDYASTDTKEHFLGTFRKVMDRFYILGAISKDEINTDINFTIERFLALTLLLYGISFIAIVFFTRHLINPIRKLTAATEKIAQGNFEVDIEKPSRDEIGLLSESFSMMVKRIRLLLEGEVQKVRIDQEVGGVAEIQQHLLPKPEINTDRYEIQSYYESATETGGDYWGYIETDTHLLLYTGDATGHGLPSAMLTSAVRGCFSALQRLYRTSNDISPTPSNFLSYANQAIMDVSQGELQMTMFVAVYSHQDHQITYANAGHSPGWIFRNRENGPELQTLLSKGPRLGESETFEAIKEHTAAFHPNDLLFIFSDGLLDCKNEEDKPLGKAAIRDSMLQSMKMGESLAETKNRITTLIRNQTSGLPPEDDITFSLLRIIK